VVVRILVLAAMALASAVCGARDPAPTLAFTIEEGRSLNRFLRQGSVAAHLLLRSGTQPRVLVAFPAGNSGIGVWFADTDRPVAWKLTTGPKPAGAIDQEKRALHGIEFDAEVDAPELKLDTVLLSSVRVLRDYQLQRTAPEEVRVAPRRHGTTLTWARDRLDGAAGYQLSIEPMAGTRLNTQGFMAAPGAPLRVRIRALTGEPPLRPLERPWRPNAREDDRARQVLEFLSYEDKFLAGSWRFNTYFGRDTLISALLLAPVLEPRALEGAIGSVLERLAANGEVAHEEDIGEFAVLRHQREGRGRVATPIYDYGMVDDDFLLAPLVAHWVTQDREHARTLLQGRQGERLVRNLLWVVERSRPFAMEPRVTNLVAIQPGRHTGNWRDSEQGLGFGRYAYDINAALVPAALQAVATLSESGLLDAHLDAAQRKTLGSARSAARVWAQRAPGFFAVNVAHEDARREVKTYAADIGIDGASAVSSLRGAALSFHALALDAAGRPIPVLHSDEGFRLLLTNPGEAELERILAILRPFPAGLVTDVGVVVANPALGNNALEREFTRNAYHGTVVWSWQQALLVAGVQRQAQRTDQSNGLRDELERARETLWRLIERTSAMRTSELWSWTYADGSFQLEPFGTRGADADESNAAQLWSTVFLGLAPASADRRPRSPSTTDTSPEN
jgi:hypothetical protein